MKTPTVTTPDMMTSLKGSLLTAAVTAFEKKLKAELPNQDYYHVVVDWEVDKLVRAEVVRMYSIAGWKRVECRTSSEGGERPGLTGLKLYRHEI